MPTKTFTNLNQTKQDAVFNALLNEFSQYKLSEAQVARIIKDCDIARGSFYKYFGDITDSYNYTLKRVLDKVHFDVFTMIKHETNNTLDSFYQATANFIDEINHSKYREFYRMYVAYNQYDLKAPSFDYHQLAKDALIMYVNGQQIDDLNSIAVIYKTATDASHNVIRAVLLGADQSEELNDLKTLFKVLSLGVVKESV
ncbi:TetR/AcrR family transcriptional regulator [Nicoliella lavandulae]|uniref:TetR/AcrR family transcriptional regulator n=1 Tax=Nicoliella lavandulae TaxID=3082954 RepID=A0ABU8SKX8_9LACO